jgi:hypothetical protein
MIRKKALIFKAVLSGAAVLAIGLVAVAQSGQPQAPATTAGRPIETMHLQTRLGSFKMLDGVGRVEMTFTGTVLLSNFKGDVNVEGDVRKEYDAHNRQAYFGTGRIVLDGQWRGVQWFGRNMNGTWTGNGLIRLFGDFDENLETGTYYYANEPDRVLHWFNGGITAQLPQATAPTGRPVERQPGARPDPQ